MRRIAQFLQAARRKPKRRRLADVLAAMPNVGEDADFARHQVDQRTGSVYLVDTDLIRESRKGDGANAGVRAFCRKASLDDEALYLSVITIGEPRRGIERLRHRGDVERAHRSEQWLVRIVKEYGDAILRIDEEIA